jgi:hypothetical protein
MSARLPITCLLNFRRERVAPVDSRSLPKRVNWNQSVELVHLDQEIDRRVRLQDWYLAPSFGRSLTLARLGARIELGSR